VLSGSENLVGKSFSFVLYLRIVVSADDWEGWHTVILYLYSRGILLYLSHGTSYPDDFLAF